MNCVLKNWPLDVQGYIYDFLYLVYNLSRLIVDSKGFDTEFYFKYNRIILVSVNFVLFVTYRNFAANQLKEN
jgi:hypothetical protein